MDEYHRDGIAAGFLCYPVDGFAGEDRAEQILQFRDDLRDAILEKAGAEAVNHRDGIAAGFLCYPVDGFAGEDRAEQILQFRDDLRDAILEKAGAEAVTFLGGATGLYYGYLDFLAWDLPAVLDAARDFFEDSQIDQGGFHTFRRDVGTVRLWEKEIEPDIHPETGTFIRRPAPCSRQRISRPWRLLMKGFPVTLEKCSAGYRILSKMA